MLSHINKHSAHFELLICSLEELDFFRMLLFFDLSSLCLPLLNRLALSLQLVDGLLKLTLVVLQVGYLRPKKAYCY